MSQECPTLWATAYHLHQHAQKLIQRILKNLQALKMTLSSSRLEVVAVNLRLLQRRLQLDSARKSRQLHETLV